MQDGLVTRSHCSMVNHSVVAAASWSSNGGFYERVYYTADDNSIREGGFDPGGAFSWRARTQSNAPFPFSARLAALAVQDEIDQPDPRRYVGVVVGAWSGSFLQVCRPEGDLLTEEYTDDKSLKTTSNVFGAVQGGRAWMFAVTDSKLLRACRKVGLDYPWACRTADANQAPGLGRWTAWNTTGASTCSMHHISLATVNTGSSSATTTFLPVGSRTHTT